MQLQIEIWPVSRRIGPLQVFPSQSTINIKPVRDLRHVLKIPLSLILAGFMGQAGHQG
jgi:hypothetical protein